MRSHTGWRIFLLASLVLVTVSMTRVAAQDPTDAELRRLNEAFAQAWAKGDAKALAGVHTSEAVIVGVDGKVTVGRAAIEQSMTALLAGPFRGTKIGLTAGQTKRAGQDVYVSEGTFQILGGMPPAGSVTRGRYLSTLVRVSGRWQFASFGAIAASRPPVK